MVNVAEYTIHGSYGYIYISIAVFIVCIPHWPRIFELHELLEAPTLKIPIVDILRSGVIPNEVIFGDHMSLTWDMSLFGNAFVELTSHWDNVLLEIILLPKMYLSPGSPTPRPSLPAVNHILVAVILPENDGYCIHIVHRHGNVILSWHTQMVKLTTLQIHEVHLAVFMVMTITPFTEVHDFHIHLPGILFSKSGGFTSHVCSVYFSE